VRLAPTFDLQSHSLASDGTLPPAEVVGRAATAGVELLALTDHDTVDGVPEAREAARAHGVRLSPAAELSAVHGGYEDLHVLGYELDVDDPALGASLADFRRDRGRRIVAMAARLRELGLAVDDAPLAARRAAGDPIGRPHLAAAVLEHPRNARRLEREGIAGPRELFPAYLVPGAPAYVPRSRPTVAEAIAVIHAAGGVAVWAHPFFDIGDREEARATLDAFVADGLDGVECFYVTHTREQTEWLYAELSRRELLATGSADFHGPEHAAFNAFRAFDTFGLQPRLGPIGQG
jgi:3',5'-nucleoside bisphosphate phosphatase